MIFFVVLLLFISQNVLAELTEEEGNSYVDTLLQKLKNYPELEPMDLPNHTIPILSKLPFIRSEISLTEGEIFGLSDITRDIDVSLKDDDDDDEFTIVTSNLELSNLNIRYLIRVIFFSKEQKPFNISGYMNNNKVVLKLRVNKNDRSVTVDDFQINKLSGFLVDLKMFGNIFKWIENVFKTIVVNILKKDITSIVEERIRDILEREAALLNVEYR